LELDTKIEVNLEAVVMGSGFVKPPAGQLSGVGFQCEIWKLQAAVIYIIF
jgi:hypothetical protein